VYFCNATLPINKLLQRNNIASPGIGVHIGERWLSKIPYISLPVYSPLEVEFTEAPVYFCKDVTGNKTQCLHR
jgi:hypothetical protein